MIISAVDASNFPERVRALAKDDPFACRILSLYSSYRPELAFVDYWLTIDLRGDNGVIARNGSNFILLLTERSNLAEISSFLRLSGATGVLCSGDYHLDFSGREATGYIMKRSEPVEEERVAPVMEPSIRAAYYLLLKCAGTGFSPPPFEDFYVDVNHKLRHGSTRLYGIEQRGLLAAVAMTVAESSDGAVVGAVACDPLYRRRGYASMIVRHMTNSLIREGKTVFLHRAANANAAFYEGMGFENCGTWREYSI